MKLTSSLATTELQAQSEIRAARETLDWNQQELADACDLSRTLVSAIENGAAERMAAAMRGPLRERVADSLDTDDPDAAALAALRGLRRVQS